MSIILTDGLVNCIEGNTVRRKFNNGVVTKALFLFYLFIYYNKINFSKEYFNVCLNINSLNAIEEKLIFLSWLDSVTSLEVQK